MLGLCPTPERSAFDGPAGLVTIKVLVDENLPRTLAVRLGTNAIHATTLGERMPDSRLWRYAKEHGCVILTKDADFFDRVSLEGAPPKVVWIRLGNLRRSAMENEIVRQWPAVLALLESADLVEVHADRLEGLTFVTDP